MEGGKGTDGPLGLENTEEAYGKAQMEMAEMKRRHGTSREG